VKSKDPQKIISEFQAGLKGGHRLFELCAEDVGAYGVDIGLDAIDLLELLVDLSDDPSYKIVINQLSPVHLKRLFSGFDKIFATGKISRLGVQVESGSERILKLMGRSHSKAADWRNMMLYINKKHPRIDLATHFLVGFPTETEEDFQATMRLMNFPLYLKNVTVYRFWANPHVPALRLKGQIPQNVIKSRADRLQLKFYETYFLNLAVHNSYLLSSRGA
jgi:tRNA-2-methylthio-N6-dimethylallyladenosine synthase